MARTTLAVTTPSSSDQWDLGGGQHLDALAVLWAACRVVGDQAELRVLAASVDPTVDGPWLTSVATVNRAGPMLWSALAAAGCAHVLGSGAEPLRLLSTAQQLAATAVVPTAVRLAVEPLVAAGLEPLVLKGPALAQRYPGTGLRPMDDLDLLLPSRQHEQAVEILRGAGWAVRRGRQLDRYDTVLVHEQAPGLPLELHAGLQTFYEWATGLRATAIWGSRRPLVVEGTAAYGLDTETELVVLAAHAAKPYHGFNRLIWAVDLAVVVHHAAGGRGVDWERLCALARHWRCHSALGVGLTLARRLGAEVPEEVLQVLCETWAPWQRRALAPVLAATWPAQGSVSVAFYLRFALADTVSHRAALAAGAAYQMPWAERVTWPVVGARRAARRWQQLHGGSRVRSCRRATLGAGKDAGDGGRTDMGCRQRRVGQSRSGRRG